MAAEAAQTLEEGFELREVVKPNSRSVLPLSVSVRRRLASFGRVQETILLADTLLFEMLLSWARAGADGCTEEEEEERTIPHRTPA